MPEKLDAAPLFEADVDIDYEDYLRFFNSVSVKSKQIRRPIIIIIAALAALAVLAFFLGDYSFSAAAVIAAVAFPILFRFFLKRQIKKTYDSNKLMQDGRAHYSFFEDCYNVSAAYGASKISYSDLYAVYETDTDLYLMHGADSGNIIPKRDCSEDLIKFLNSKKAGAK